MMYVDKYFAERGHLIHKLKAKDSTGRWAYYFVYVKPDLEQAFLKALESGQIIDLEDYGKVIGSCYGEKPSKQLRSFLKEKYGFDVQSSSINLKKVIMNKEALLVDSFRKVFESMNQEGIKESVDKMELIGLFLIVHC
ncbi:MAG: hypothetical protein HC773_22435 [Scytonema sp. CRU_2_7]|nr:hypothetical protein [Scytonema sp. CRU_2_7]